MKQHDLTVHHLPAVQLQQHPENANNGDVDAIEESIRVNGVYRPIYAQLATHLNPPVHFVLAGNTTFEAMMRLRMDPIAVILLDVTDEEALRILLVDNEAAKQGSMDEAQLYNLLDSLRGTEQGLAGTGYDFHDLEYLHQLVNDPLTAADLGVDVADGDAEGAPGAKRGKRLDFSVIPTADENGGCETIVLSRPDFRHITAADFQAVLVALGQRPLSRGDLARQGIMDWE